MEKRNQKTKLNIEQLNMEQVATKIATNSNKEEKAMKGRKFLVLLTTIILVASMMVACGSDTSANQSASNNDNDQDEIQVDDPVEDETDVAEPDEDETDVTVPDDETTPDEDVADPEPVEEDDPNVIDGIDFTEFHNGNEALPKILSEQSDKLDTLEIIAVKDMHVQAILHDGDYITQDDGNYSFYVCSPKAFTSITPIDSKQHCYEQKDLGITEESVVIYCVNIGFADIVEDEPCGVTVTFEDGTEETITIYVTKDYEIEN